MKYDVFISFSSKDQKVVEGLCAYLEQHKIRCFVSYRDIPHGVVWAKAIVDALEESRMMLVVFSENFNNSDQVDREIEIASEEKKPILTFRIADEAFKGAKKYYLKNLNWIDAFPHPEKTFGYVVDNISALLGMERSDVEPITAQEKQPTQTAGTVVQSSIEDKSEEIETKIERTDKQQSAKKNEFFDRLKMVLLIKKPAIWLSTIAVLVVVALTAFFNSSYSSYDVGVSAVNGSNTSESVVVEDVKEIFAEAAYCVGDYYDDGTKQGVVFVVSEDGTHGKIVSLKEAELEWCTKKQYDKNILVGAGSENDGKVNTDIVMRRSDYAEYPAFKWCREQGSEWYLPSTNELQELYKVKDVVNKTLTKYDYQEIAGPYWSSTEKGEPCAWLVHMSRDYTYIRGKYYRYNGYVRAVSAF